MAVTHTHTHTLNLRSITTARGPVVSAGTAGAYWLVVSAVAAGSFKVTVGNLSGGSLSQAIVLNYAVIKSAAS